MDELNNNCRVSLHKVFSSGSISITCLTKSSYTFLLIGNGGIKYRTMGHIEMHAPNIELPYGFAEARTRLTL